MNSVETDIYRVSDVKLFFFWIAFFGTFANKFGYSEVPKKNVTFLIIFSYQHGLITLESGIDVGQRITVGPGIFV